MTDAPVVTNRVTPSIREVIADNLKTNLPTLTRSKVIDYYAEKEADKQAKALIGGIDKLAQMQRELNTIKPQVNGFNANGEAVGEPTFTKDQIDNRKKLREQIDKLERALNKADDNGDFGDLYNIIK